MPQLASMLLVKKNVREELLSALPGKKAADVADRVGEMAALCRLEGLLAGVLFVPMKRYFSGQDLRK